MHDLKHMVGEIGLIPGSEPGTAYRVRSACAEGCVILEQLRHSGSAGWYVQRSFPVPTEMLQIIVREMRKADCLTPRRTTKGADLRIAL